MEESLERGTDEPYFLGSIVLVKAKGNAPAEVIDGQQRLTTLTILLALLRDLTEDPDLRSDLDRLVTEPGNKVRRLAPKPRLTLRYRDASFFQQYVQTKGATEALRTLGEEKLPTDAQKAVLRNTKALHAILADWSEERRLDPSSAVERKRPSSFCRGSTPRISSGCQSASGPAAERSAARCLRSSWWRNTMFISCSTASSTTRWVYGQLPSHWSRSAASTQDWSRPSNGPA
ncbi:GmrSD restriction endonuclease domain-containing protein [Streptomyces sp. NPDC004059]